MPRDSLRIVLISRDIELRIVSLIVRAREAAEEVIFLDLGSNDSSVDLASEIDCQVMHFNDEISPQSLAKFINQSGLEEIDSTLLLMIGDEWKMRDLPISINRSSEGWDVHLSHHVLDVKESSEEELILQTAQLEHLILTPSGIETLSHLSPLATARDLDESLKVRIVPARRNLRIPQRESLATASRFAQLFYWMLETKHPLLLFGIPGIVLFILGYKLSGDVVGTLQELNSTSIGVTLATIAMTLIGLFGIMVALILYIMGKQVEQIQSQYDWPSRN